MRAVTNNFSTLQTTLINQDLKQELNHAKASSHANLRSTKTAFIYLKVLANSQIICPTNLELLAQEVELGSNLTTLEIKKVEVVSTLEVVYQMCQVLVAIQVVPTIGILLPEQECHKLMEGTRILDHQNTTMELVVSVVAWEVSEVRLWAASEVGPEITPTHTT
jgi:hypothetical protein